MNKYKSISAIIMVLLFGNAVSAAEPTATASVAPAATTMRLVYPDTPGLALTTRAVLSGLGRAAADQDKPLMVKFAARSEEDAARIQGWLVADLGRKAGASPVYVQRRVDPAAADLVVEVGATPESVIHPQ